MGIILKKQKMITKAKKHIGKKVKKSPYLSMVFPNIHEGLISTIVSSLLCKKFSRKSMVAPKFNLLKPP